MDDSNNLSTELTNVLRFAKTIEALLGHYLDWLIRKIGYTNAGIWLVNEENQLQLFARFNYSEQFTDDVLSFIESTILPQMVSRNILQNDGLTCPPFSKEQPFCFLVIKCIYLEETCGMIVLFRPANAPYNRFDEDTLRIVEASELIFSHSIASFADDVNEHLEDGEEPRKRDPADWWKNGGEAPH